MDVPTLSWFLRPIFTVTSVWNPGETGDIHLENDMFFKIHRDLEKINFFNKTAKARAGAAMWQLVSNRGIKEPHHPH